MKKFLFLFISFVSINCNAQNDRLNDFNSINWLQSINTISIHKNWSLHAEYQWRRTNGLKNWQQSLLRVGVNYKLNDNVTLHSGYAWIETFSYGQFPIAANGTFPEHRIYEQASFRQPLNKWTFTHRFRIEQRWLGRVKPGTNREIEGWTFLHRFRYQFKSQFSLWQKKEKQFYGVFADEILVGAGKNVGINIFDQNRLFLLAGFKLSKQFSLEAGYVNQTLQQGRRVNDKTIMQRNNGCVLTSILNF